MEKKIPQQLPPCQSGVYWVIEEGDTLYFISRKLNIPLEKILAVNEGIDPLNLQIGSKVCIPVDYPAFQE